MMSKYNIIIDMNFDSEDQMYEVEEKIYNACQLIFDNFENITIKINKDETFVIDGYQKTISEYSVKQVNTGNNEYDF